MERAAARYVGAGSMYFIGKRLKKKHKIEDERESLYSALREWTAALGSRKFLGKDVPKSGWYCVLGWEGIGCGWCCDLGWEGIGCG